jgi:hypothetical protein
LSLSRLRWRHLAIALFFLGCIAAALMALRLVPTEIWMAHALERWFGRGVEIGAVAVRLREELEVELIDLRVREPGAAVGAAPVLEIARARGHQPWPRLLAGQLLPLRWSLERPVLRIGVQTAEATRTAAPDLPELDLEIRDGRVEWRQETGPPLELRSLTLEARRGGLATPTTGNAAGELYRGDASVCALQLSFEGWLDGGSVRGQVSDLDLAQLPRDLLAMRGTAAGSFSLEHAAGRDELGVDLELTRLDVQPPGFKAPLRPRRAHLDGSLTWRASSADLVVRRLQLDDANLGGTVHLDRESRRTRGQIAVAPFEPGPRDQLHPVSILGLIASSWIERNARIEAGRVLDAEITWDVALEKFGDTFAFKRAPEPGEVGIALRVEDGRYRLDGGRHLNDISGQLRIDGNVLSLSELRIRGDDGWLPQIELQLEGMDRFTHLPDAEKRAPRGPRSDVPGLPVLVEALSGQGGDPAPGARFNNLELYHSSLLLPVREASGQLRQVGTELHVEIDSAVVGGVPAALALKYLRETAQLGVQLRYGPGVASPAPPRADHWLRGKLALDSMSIVGWPVDDARLDLRAVEDRLLVDRLDARFAQGQLRGSGEVFLGESGSVPYELELALESARATELAPLVGLEPADLRGSLAVRGHLAGRLQPEYNIREIDAELDLELRDGHLGGLPSVLAIARLPSLQGARGMLGAPLRYKTTVGHVEIHDGMLTLADARLDGPELRMLADGQMDLQGPDRERDFLVTLLFLQTVDRVIKTIPLLRSVMLGKDENLLAASFRVSGPDDDIRVGYVPPERLQTATSWATGVISSGARRLGRMIRPRAESQEDADTTPEPGPRQDPGTP